jgi:RNA polymerase sigma factor (sigma-70 family)
MFKENIGLAKYIAYSYYKLNDNFTYEDYEDLKQEAMIELWKSSNDYVDIGYKFQTYANKRIRRRLYHVLNSKKIIIQDNIKGAYEVDFDKNLMLCEISNALDKIKVDNSYVKSDIGKYATILKLEGATDTEIAKILGSNPSNVKRSIEITIKRLQKILKIEE